MNNNRNALSIIFSPKGAGKAMIAKRALPDTLACTEYVNTDTVVASLPTFAPESDYLKKAIGTIVLKYFTYE